MKIPNYKDARKRSKEEVLIRNFSLDNQYLDLGKNKKFFLNAWLSNDGTLVTIITYINAIFSALIVVSLVLGVNTLVALFLTFVIVALVYCVVV